MNASANAPKRSPWPYAIAGYFLLAIIFLATFIIWSVKQRTDLVGSDYYEQEISYQHHIDAVNRTRPLLKDIAVDYDSGTQTIRMRVPASQAAGDFSGKAHFYRPSDEKLDRQIELRPDRAGGQTFDTAGLVPGLWKVRLEWAAGGEAYVFERDIVIGG